MYLLLLKLPCVYVLAFASYPHLDRLQVITLFTAVIFLAILTAIYFFWNRSRQQKRG